MKEEGRKERGRGRGGGGSGNAGGQTAHEFPDISHHKTREKPDSGRPRFCKPAPESITNDPQASFLQSQ